MFFKIIIAVTVGLQDIDLAKEAHERADQVFIEVKVVMSHIRRGEEESRTCALVLELVCMADRDELVKLPVHDKSGAGHLVHPTQVIKLLSQ